MDRPPPQTFPTFAAHRPPSLHDASYPLPELAPQPAPSAGPHVSGMFDAGIGMEADGPDGSDGPEPKPDDHHHPSADGSWFATQHYVHETVMLLLACTQKAGYGAPGGSSLKDVFARAVALAESEHGIKRTAKGWNKKFSRMRVQYNAFLARLVQAGRDPDERGLPPGLPEEPYFFRIMHEMETGRRNHLAGPCLRADAGEADEEADEGGERARLRKKGGWLSLSEEEIDGAQEAFLVDYAAKQERRTRLFVEELRRANESRVRFVSAVERLVEKL